MNQKTFLKTLISTFLLTSLLVAQQAFTKGNSDLYPNTISAEEAARLSLEDLEKKYLEDRCGNSCSDLLRRDLLINDLLSLAEQIVISRYTEVNKIENHRIMLAGLNKLPGKTKTLYRGDDIKRFKISKLGQIILIDRITSTSINRMKAEEFITDQLLKIKAKSARDIQKYSVVSEGEHILLPAVKLRVDKISTIKVDLSYADETNIKDVQFVELTEI